MSYMQKYLKYRKKYLELKKQIAGLPLSSNDFLPLDKVLFGVYSVTKNELPEEHRQELLTKLKSIYGSENVSISTNYNIIPFNNLDTSEDYARSFMVDFIRKRYNDTEFKYIVEFIITNPSLRLNDNWDNNDSQLTNEENKIGAILSSTSFTLSDFSKNPADFVDAYDHGWGLSHNIYGKQLLLIPLVLKTEDH